MPTYLALLRGINVGGNHKLPMAGLRQLLTEAGFGDVATYIQSGNVVFKSKKAKPAALATKIEDAIEDKFGFRPRTLVLSADDFESAATANPFPEAEADHKTLHLYFLSEKPAAPDLDKLHALKLNGDDFKLIGTVFYLLAPGGVGRSKLAEKVERALGVAATARNWRTVTKLREMLP